MNYHDLRALLVKRFNIPQDRVLRQAIRRFTLAEKTVFYFFVGLFALTGAILLLRVNNTFLDKVPVRGGSLTEGVVGNPRFLNPVLDLSEADKDLVALVYSGLMRAADNGQMVNDLADYVETSPDGLTYTAHINPNATFQDGTPVTADDVIFTVEKIQDPAIKSPHEGDWVGVSVSKQDDSTVVFTLKKPYAPFLENLSLGILPKHIWSSVTADEFSFSQYNSLPIGSGPYKIDIVERDAGGIPNYYNLVAFNKYVGGEPYISHIIFKFYSNEGDLLSAYNGGDVQSLAGVSPAEAAVLKKSGASVASSPLPRIFGVFFNQNQSKVLHDPDVRQALALAAPREQIVDQILGSYATVIDSPLPPNVLPEASASTTSYEDNLAAAQTLLTKAGWKKNDDTGLLEKKTKSDTLTLSFSISTSDTAELKDTANALKEAWGKLGAQVSVLVFEPGDLNQNVIRPRRYDALLFGEVVGRDADLYPFWHSSERNDPGLNIALYANSKVDKLLDDARATADASKRESDYAQFALEVSKDNPAVFLYAPNFLYVVPKSVQGLNLGNLASPEDRFSGIGQWYIETSNVWQIFAKKQPVKN